MRALFFGLSILIWSACGTFLLQAQTSPGTNSMISFLTPAEQEEYASARAKALAANPDLKTEGQNLMQQGKEVMANGTMADKQAFMEKMNSHRQKLREAMLKVDPAVEPIFAKIDKNISELKARATARLQKSTEATNAPPASPTVGQ